jgi:hypothetical protein
METIKLKTISALLFFNAFVQISNNEFEKEAINNQIHIIYEIYKDFKNGDFIFSE